MGLFKDSLKKWFYTNSSSAASSDARIPLLTATGDPKGSDTMANVASVLGVIPGKVGTTFATDLNDYNTYNSAGAYSVNVGTANIPTGFSNGICIVIARTGDRITQILLSLDSSNIHRRSYWDAWTEWQQVYDTSLLTNQTLLTQLASALGVNKYFRYSNVLQQDSGWDTGIKIGKFGGGTILGIYSGSFGNGDSTVSHIFAIRRSYDNSGAGGLYDIVSTNEHKKVTMTISSNNNIVLSSPCSNARILLISYDF